MMSILEPTLMTKAKLPKFSVGCKGSKAF